MTARRPDSDFRSRRRAAGSPGEYWAWSRAAAAATTSRTAGMIRRSGAATSSSDFRLIIAIAIARISSALTVIARWRDSITLRAAATGSMAPGGVSLTVSGREAA